MVGLFEPNVEKLRKKKDIEGLIKALVYYNHEGAFALRNIGDARVVKSLTIVLKD